MGVDIFGATGNEIVMDHVLGEPRRLADLLSVTEGRGGDRAAPDHRVTGSISVRSVYPRSADVGYADGAEPSGHAAPVVWSCRSARRQWRNE
jgi:hypothetical protein